MFLADVLIVLFVFKSPLYMLGICHCQLSVFGQSGLCFHFHNSILGAEAFHFDKIRLNTFFLSNLYTLLHLRKLCLPQACDDFLFFLRLL